MGDVLPNQQSFKFNKSRKVNREPVELGNVTKKVQNAILSILDMYFACKCDEFTDSQIDSLDNMGTIMEAHIKVLWSLKQGIMYEEPRETQMRKLHAHNHIGQHIRLFGPIIYADTDTYESAHKFFTTGVWRGTSKRLGTLNKEMSTASVIQSHAMHLNFYTKLLKDDGISQCQKAFGPKVTNDSLTINPFTNVCDIRFVITSDLDRDGNNILRGHGIHRDLFKDSLFGHSGLPSIKHLSQHLKRRWGNNVSTWTKLTKANSLGEFSIVRAASYQGSKDSAVGKGVIYATSNYRGEGKRYDYVKVKVVVEDQHGEEVEDYAVAQVLLILQAHAYEMKENKRVLKHSQWFFIVQYMETIKNIGELTSKPHTSHQHMSQLKWELANQSGRISSNKTTFSIDLITLDSIAGSAMVIPCFSFHEKVKNKKTAKKIDTPIAGKPDVSDVFWYIDRMFFDRSGWEELEIHNSSNSSNTNTNEINVNNIQSFINNNTIQPAEEIKEAEDFPEFYYAENDEDISNVLDNENEDY